MTVVTSSLRLDLTGNFVANAAQVTAALEKTRKDAVALEAALAKSGTTDGLQARLKGIKASALQIDAVSASWKEYAKAEGLAGKAGSWTKEQKTAVRAWESSTVSAIRSVKSEEASLARLRSEQASRAAQDAEREARARITAMEREERAARRQAEMEARLQHQIAHQREEAVRRGGVGHYVAGTVAAGVSAHGVVRGIEYAAEQGADLQHVRVDMRGAGIPQDEIQRIENQALALSGRYANVGQTAIMELAKEARSVLLHPDEVPHILGTLTAAKSVLDAKDKTGEASGGLGMLIKGAESIGAAQDPERLTKLVDAYVKAIQVMGKTISPEQIYEFDKYSKTAGATMSDRFLMTTGLSLSQEMGGSTAANDIFHAQKDIVGGFQNKHAPLKEMVRLGLIDRGDVDYTKAGEAKGIKAGHKGVHDAGTAQTDLDLWVYNTFLPALEKKGITGRQAQLAEVNKIFTGGEADVISKLITQRESFENHAKMYPKASGLKGADQNVDDPTVGLQAVEKALGNLAAQVTSPAMGTAGRTLYHIADGLNYLANVAKDHPLAALATGAVAAGGGLAASGVLAYKMLNGFGLGTSATALSTSAGLLDEAAVALGAKGLLPGGAVAAAGSGAVATAAGAVTAEGAAAAAATVGGVAVLGAAAALIYKSYEAQQPGMGGAYSAPTPVTESLDRDRLADMRQDAADTKAKIDAAVARSKNGNADIVTIPLRDHLQEVQNQINELQDGLKALHPPLPPTRPAELAPPPNDGVTGDRATRSRAEDAARPSLWHRIFGAAEGESIHLKDAQAGLRGTTDTLQASFASLSASAANLGTVLGSAGAGGGNGGIVNASYETGDAGAEARGGGGSNPYVGVKDSASAREHAEFIKRAASALGIDPSVALRVAASEGLGRSHAGGDKNTSFGDFQMHYKNNIHGLSMSGLGDVFNKETGLDGRDPKNWRELDLFALKKAREQGWAPWHGAARVHIHGRQGIGALPHDNPVSLLPRRAAPAHPRSDITAGLMPAVNNKHLRETAALLDHIHNRMAAVGTMSARVHRGNGEVRVAGLGSRLRGGFSHAGAGFG